MNQSKTVSVSELFPVTEDLLTEGTGVKFTVSGDSMMPWIRSYRDQVLMVPAGRIKKGYIVLFKVQEKYILHRVYRIKNDHMCTMGDGCLHTDGFFPLSCVIGKVAKIYRGSHVIDCSKDVWRIVFALWRCLRFVRKHLLIMYMILVKFKRMFLKPAL